MYAMVLLSIHGRRRHMLVNGTKLRAINANEARLEVNRNGMTQVSDVEIVGYTRDGEIVYVTIVRRKGSKGTSHRSLHQNKLTPAFVFYARPFRPQPKEAEE
jgi:hypothetical protein